MINKTKDWEDKIIEIENRYTDNMFNVDIVFTGASNIRRWKTLKNDMYPYNVVNTGFGGSKLADSIFYFDRIVTPYNPKAIFFYSGSNDMHGKNTIKKNAQETFDLFKQFYIKSQTKLPQTIVYFISIMPTKARWDEWKEGKKLNQLILEFANFQNNLVYIDATSQFLDKYGMPNKNLFVDDKLHLNHDGYKVWNDIIKPIVKKYLK